MATRKRPKAAARGAWWAAGAAAAAIALVAAALVAWRTPPRPEMSAHALLRAAAAAHDAALQTLAPPDFEQAEALLRAVVAHPGATAHERSVALYNLAEHLQHPRAGRRQGEAMDILAGMHRQRPGDVGVAAKLAFVQLSMARTQPGEASRPGSALMAATLDAAPNNNEVHTALNYMMLIDGLLRQGRRRGAWQAGSSSRRRRRSRRRRSWIWCGGGGDGGGGGGAGGAGAGGGGGGAGGG